MLSFSVKYLFLLLMLVFFFFLPLIYLFKWYFCSKGDGKGIWMRSPHTPKAPRHGPRPPSRLKFSEMRQVAAVLFPESAFPSRCMVPSALPKPLCKSLASNRVLFYEDELCQAVAQNKLRWFYCGFLLPNVPLYIVCFDSL